MAALNVDILELACHLKQERLYVNTERENLQKLNEDVKRVAEEMNHASWVAKQQRSILESLIRSSQDASPAECCGRINQLDHVNFVDSYKYLSYHDSKYGEFLKLLRESPRLLARCIAVCEKDTYEVAQSLVGISMSSIYGNCVMQEDEVFVLHLLKTLLEIQLATSNDPRRLIRKGTCSFSLVFKQFFDNLFSAKLFLTAALYEPVMRLLMEDDWFYDIDPDKAVIRFPPAERKKRFGEPGTEDYKARLASYRKSIVDKLVTLSMRFVNSIKNNLHCFPSSLIWIVSQVFQTLTKSNHAELADIRATCADLVFGLFICPAICDPEPFGITSDVPISHIARHNLIQMAQIVQVLAMSKFEDIDPKVRDVYGRFERGCMSNVLDAMLDGNNMDTTQPQPYNRAAVLISRSQLGQLLMYLRSAVPLLDEGSSEKRQLEEMLSRLPAVLPVMLNSQTSTPSHTPPGTPVSQKKARAIKKRPSHGLSEDSVSTVSEDSLDPDSASASALKQPEDVIVISLGHSFDCPGMLSEQKVLSLENETRRRRVKYQDDLSYEVNGQVQEIQEKRTRFSLSHDQESIGNTSDIQEAISEAASSHSVGSVDLENDNDNFSDMLSANVSGRGTPNISGRDTPLSQAESVEERRAPDLPETVHKTNREDVTERFGKFEIRPELERDEAKSTVSETWSTDVLASDSEATEQNQMERLEEVTEEIVRQNFLPEPTGEVSETASESAWSTDVLASDTDDKQSELLTDLEQDDISSVEERSRPGDDDRDLDVLDADDTQGEGNKEDTPQASGGQSPSEDREDFGAVGGRESIFRSNRPSVRICNSDSIIPSKTAADSLDDFDEDGVVLRDASSKQRSVSDIVQNFQTKAGQEVITSNKRQSDSLRAAEGKVTTLLAALEGDTTATDEKSGLKGSGLNRRYLYQGARPKIQIISESMDSDLSSSSTDPVLEIYNDEKPELDEKNRNFDLNELGQTDSGISDTPIEDYFAVASPSSDVLSSDSVKLSEQQNTKLDAKRLSTSLSMFDPLTPGDDDMDFLGENHSAFDSDQVSVETNVTQSSSNRSSRASLKSVILADGSLSGSSERQGILLPSRSSTEAGSQDLITVNQLDADSGRRDSSGSSQSTHSTNINDLSGTSPKADTNSVKSDEKEIVEYEDKIDHGKRKKGNFLNKFKEKIGKGMRKKGSKIDKDDVDAVLGASIGEGAVFDSKIYIPGQDNETTDDILDKYRKKAVNPSSSPNQFDGVDSDKPHKEKGSVSKEDESTTAAPFYDPNNLEGCFAFQDAKRKLRLVLSTGDFQVGVCFADLLIPGSGQLSPREHDGPRHENDLVKLLRMQLAEALNLQNKDLIAQLHEAIRCVRRFDTKGCKKLLKSLQEEYRVRSAYVAYLVRCRQGLLMSLSHLQKLNSRINRDKEVCSKHFTNVCVRLFIESKERAVLKFMSDFQKLTVSDEKTDLVDRFLRSLYEYMERDPMWEAANEIQLEDARLSLERFIMSRIYTHAMFPNGDGDMHRDQIFRQHIHQLSQVITPTHRDVRIPAVYHHECPWPEAQREILLINAYKTPKDKLQCVIRCSKTIMNLLRLANEKSIPAADDFMPVFIYVLIKANPTNLLSTIQYVSSFYEGRIQGEEQYWWMQLCSAVEFIKTMN